MRSLQATLLVILIVISQITLGQVSPARVNSYGPNIFKGTSADNRSSTYMVALMREGMPFPSGFLCGATVIADEWALTAAHCLYDGDCTPWRYSQIYAFSDQVVLNPDLPKLRAKEIVAHSNFVCVPEDQQINAVKNGIPIPMGNDIGLVRLDGLRLPKQPLFLAAIRPAEELSPLVASGWGSLNDTKQISSTLMSINLSQMPAPSCTKAWAPSTVSSDQLCVGPLKQGPLGGVCSGDSGGPLIATIDNERVQVGIVSFGHLACSHVDRPSLFTNVATHLTWIEKQIGRHALPTRPVKGAPDCSVDKITGMAFC